MFDLKMCLLDFMRLSSSGASPPKPKKSLREISDRYSSQYMQKYNDVNIIYFNENMSMTSKNNTVNFSSCPIGTFKPSPMNKSFSNRRKSIREWGVETVCFDFSSDDRTGGGSGGGGDGTGTSTSNGTPSDSSLASPNDSGAECLCNFSENALTGPLDSFCTLCTSSFSFSKCNKCDESTCSSKCHSADDKSIHSFMFRSFENRR